MLFSTELKHFITKHANNFFNVFFKLPKKNSQLSNQFISFLSDLKNGSMKTEHKYRNPQVPKTQHHKNKKKSKNYLSSNFMSYAY